MGMKSVRLSRGQAILQDGPSAKSIRTIVGGSHGGTVHTKAGDGKFSIPPRDDTRVFYSHATTPRPKSNEMPTRGEGPERNIKTKKGS